MLQSFLPPSFLVDINSEQLGNICVSNNFRRWSVPENLGKKKTQ